MKLSEAALHRDAMDRRINNLLPQVIENWALVKYVKLSGYKKELLNHWRTELKSYIMKISNFELKKSGTKQKLALIKKIFNEYDFDTRPSVIEAWFISKFETEGIPETYNDQICKSFVDGHEELIQELVAGTKQSINKYAESL